MENTFTNDNVNIDPVNEITRPCIDHDQVCFTKDHVKISECIIKDNGDISGFTDDHVKALYKYDQDKWFFGSDISKLNLISLKERTKDERLQIIAKANEKKRENNERKRNFNDLARAMLEQTLSEKQIKTILGDNTTMLLDDSVGSVMIGAMIQGALNGSFKCAEFVRDTAGYKPKNEVEINADIMTDNDRALIEKALKSG